jgi:hypothetical protein
VKKRVGEKDKKEEKKNQILCAVRRQTRERKKDVRERMVK